MLDKDITYVMLESIDSDATFSVVLVLGSMNPEVIRTYVPEVVLEIVSEEISVMVKFDEKVGRTTSITCEVESGKKVGDKTLDLTTGAVDISVKRSLVLSGRSTAPEVGVAMMFVVRILIIPSVNIVRGEKSDTSTACVEDISVVVSPELIGSSISELSSSKPSLTDGNKGSLNEVTGANISLLVSSCTEVKILLEEIGAGETNASI